MSTTIVTSDGDIFKIDSDIAQKSNMIKEMFEGISSEGKIPIQVDSVTFAKILEYLEHYKDDWPKIPTDEERYCDSNKEGIADINDWDKEYIVSDDTDSLEKLTLGANFLEITPLLHLCCKSIANIISECKDAEEIRQKFGIENDFTPEEEAKVREENAWAFNN